MRREGQYPMDYDASPHPVFKRVLDPALKRAFPKHSDDHDSEKDLVGSIDKNEDWATSLQSEERSIQKEDQKVEAVKKVEKVDKTEKKEAKPAEEKKEEKPADAKKEDKPKKGEQDVAKIEDKVKDIDEQMDDIHKEINPEKIAPVSEEVAVKAPAAKEETSIKVEATPVNSTKVASVTNSTAKLEVYGNKTNSTVPVSVAKVNATANSTSLDPFAELKQEKDFMNLAQKPKSVSLLQIDQ
jgi:hypothetical protein